MGNDDRFIPFPDFVAISIHVPAWGTTIMAAILAPLNLNFNPRSRVGNDRSSCAETNDINDFNPRSRVGNDCKVGDTVYVPTRFQSTFPRGERQFCHINSPFLYYFNPRSRVGNDVSEISNPVSFCISIHVPAWGTTVMYGPTLFQLIFQSTFPRGERPCRFKSCHPHFYISIHVPAWGTTIIGADSIST